MPILPAEPDVYPDDLLDVEPPSDETAAQWWALYTLPRREKELMRRLHRQRSPIIRRWSSVGTVLRGAGS